MDRIIPNMLGYFPEMEQDIEQLLDDENFIWHSDACSPGLIIKQLRAGFLQYHRGLLESADATFSSILAQLQACSGQKFDQYNASEIMVCALIGRFHTAYVGKGLKLAIEFQHRANTIMAVSEEFPAQSLVRRVMKLIDGTVLSFNGKNVEAITTLKELCTSTGLNADNLIELILSISAKIRLAVALLRVRDFDAAMDHLEQALSLSVQTNFQYGTAEALRRKGILLSYQKDIAGSIECLNEAYEAYDSIKNTHGLIQTLSSLGRNYGTFETNHAEFCYRKALDLAKSHKFMLELGTLYSLMGDVLMIQGRFQSAEKYYLQDYELSHHDESIRRKAHINRNLGRIYHIQNRLVEAITHLKASMEHFETVQDRTNYGFVALRLCQCYLDKDDLEESKKMEHSVRSIFGVNSGFESSLCDMMLGMIYRKEHSYEAAILILKKSLRSQEQFAHSFAYVRTNLELANAYKDSGDIEAYKRELVKVIKLSRHHYFQEIEDKALDYLREVDEKEWARLRNIVYLGVSSENQESKEIMISVMYADIRNYSRLTHENESTKMAEFVNDFFNIVSRIVYAHGGFVNKYIGDCVMSLFGLDNELINNDESVLTDSVTAAYKAALEIAKSTELLTKRWDLKGEIEVGIGIASGPVIAGYFGSLERMEFSVIGTTVNLASRIQNFATKNYALICENSAHILAGLPQIEVHEPIICKGFPEKVKVYSLKYPVL
ncbi:MAG: adenylate/guanylate cyclase domain-containing protein [Candidatus Cloacimonetes bacterium]|jgi:class 3 adenylate cyclase/predicted negative regulator of RcsB-dependent stress response|nr:tetratricopeptide repeat protein [Candidatus Cloacimonadota bacterium]MCB5269963.1 tetratricopeptide repeat protein [Candidatus Cloacimonadota bacterium]MCK9334554.1 tetratricopeptide repeat protein [Candidatus Cloacimonadota bacterium]MDD2544258.1 adenylate/guanylate cyclase domain-containing protein [Candidatus Cloacimonadota bacterium]MDD2684158.1 adenylate/guanylate cyclase domain-containing protein [Candidatus Cloacimonadota bacterium]